MRGYFPVSNATLERIRAELDDVEAQRRDLLLASDEKDLDRPVPFVYMGGAEGTHTLLELLLHVVNHSTFHRGQVVTMLRQVGAVPISTDLVVFDSESSGAS